MSGFSFIICPNALQHAEHSLCDGVQLGVDAVGTAGKDAWSCGANEHSGLADSVSELGIGLPENIGGLDVREYEAVGVTGNRAGKLLDLDRLLVNGDVEGQRTVSDAALDLSAVSHLGKSGSLKAGRH